MTKKLLIIILIIVIGGGVILGFFWWQKGGEKGVEEGVEEQAEEQVEEQPEGETEEVTAILKDTRIVTAMAQARTVMVYVYAMDANHDNFNCEHLNMKVICSEVVENGGKMNIIHDSASNSQKACMYSPLNAKENYWYCVDSRGIAGHTQINPDNQNYCVEGGDIVCPSLSE